MRVIGFLVALALAVAACGGEGQLVGQFGPYYRQTKQLRLPSGETLIVYRVKHWTFANGQPPALQLEYEAPFPVSDTARLRALTRRIWPAFAPYVEGAGLRAAIVTATNLQRREAGRAWAAQMQHFGLIAERDSTGRWRLQGDTVTLPPAEPSRTLRIFEADGRPLLVSAIPTDQ